MEFIDYLVITEKPSAMQNFSKALGGDQGQLENGGNYQLVSLQGHIMRLLEPHQMVSPVLEEKIKRWGIPETASDIWDHRIFSWKKEMLPGKEKVLENLRSFLPRTKNIVIATDNDPSGEGDLLVWEVLDFLHNNRNVLRLDFSDESRNSILRAFRNLRPVDTNLNIPVRKAEIRQRFDFLTQQYVRIATTLTQSSLEKREVINEGRLKTIILSKIYNQFELNRSFMPTTTYKVKYVDNDELGENSHKFSDRDEEHVFNSPIEANNSIASMVEAATVIEEDVKYAKRAIPILPDLSTLSGQMAKLGATSKVVLETYQKMYEKGYVSYPRTQDRKITNEQFEELRPVSESIANVIEADKSVLDFRKPSTLLAKRFIEDGGSHGANRPGTRVPDSLQELDEFGEFAQAIYLYLARRFLALFSKDATIATYSAHLSEYPKMTASKSIIVEPNWYLIIEPNKNFFSVWEGFNKVAFPIVDEAVTSRPPLMTQKTLMDFLFRQQIGTGATRVQTLAKLVDEKMVIEERGGILTNSEKGMYGARIMQGTMLASEDTTKFLHKQIDDYGQGVISEDQVLRQVKEMLKNDIPIMKSNTISKNDNDLSAVPNQDNSFGKQTTQSVDTNIRTQTELANNSEVGFVPLNVERNELVERPKTEKLVKSDNQAETKSRADVEVHDELPKYTDNTEKFETKSTPVNNDEMTTDDFIAKIINGYDVIPGEAPTHDSDPEPKVAHKEEHTRKQDVEIQSEHSSDNKQPPMPDVKQSVSELTPTVRPVVQSVELENVESSDPQVPFKESAINDISTSTSHTEHLSAVQMDSETYGNNNLQVTDGKLQYEGRKYIWSIKEIQEISVNEMKELINQKSVQLQGVTALLEERVINGVTLLEVYQEEFIF